MRTVSHLNKTAKRRMYRGIVITQAIRDVFVRATSDTAANAAIEAGKGQRMKPRFGEWELWQAAIAVDAYTASAIPANEIPRSEALTVHEVGQVYMKVQHRISVVRGGPYSDKERHAMADAVREFHNLLRRAIRDKAGVKARAV